MAYASVQTFRTTFGLGETFRDVADEIVQEHLQAGSDQADVWLQLGGYTTPLSAWGKDLDRAVCEVAAFHMLKEVVGFNPEASNDKMIEERATAARKEILLMAVLQSSHLVSGP